MALETTEHGFFGRLISKVKNTVEKATCDVEDGVRVSQKVVGVGRIDVDKDPEALTSDNHAWFIGKISKKKGNRRDSIYSEEFIEGSLDFLFKNLSEGEKAQIVMAPCFSRYFNGEGDRALGFSDEDARKFIMKIVKERFPSKVSAVCVRSVDSDPLHKELFDVLNWAIDPETSVVDPEKAFDRDCDLSNPTSLSIASFLYKASKENETLFRFFRHAVPGQARGGDDDPSSSRDYYAMTEVAVRLAEILNGRFKHGGADRQGKYDDLISSIVEAANPVSGRAVKSKNILAGLEPLIELFKGKRFEMMHLDTAKNPYKVNAERTRAKINFVMVGLVSLMAIAAPIVGGISYSKWRKADNEKRAEEIVMGMIDDALQGRCLTWDQCRWQMKPDSAFKGMVEEALRQVAIRYSITFNEVPGLRRIFLSFLINNIDIVRSVDDSNSVVRIVDTFMSEPSTAVMFAEVGVAIPEIYANLGRYRKEIFDIAEGGQQDRSVSGKMAELDGCGRIDNWSLGRPCLCEELENLGVFVGPGDWSFSQDKEVAVCKKRGFPDVLVARPHDEFKEQDFSTTAAEGVSKGYVDALRKVEMLKIPEKIRESLYLVCDVHLYSGNFRNFDFSKLKVDPSYVSEKFVHTFIDPVNRERWDLYMTGECEKFGDKLFCENVVVARNGGEGDFTFAGAMEFAQKFVDVVYSDKRFRMECGK